MPSCFKQQPTRRRQRAACGGQAAIEFLAGIIVILAVFAAIAQLVSLTRADLDGMSRARREAGRLALTPLEVANNPEYILNWKPGDDNRTYSRDDTHTLASAGDFASAFTEPLAPAQPESTLMARIPHNAIQDLSDSARPVTRFGLVSARVLDSVSLLPAVRHLLYDATDVELENIVWLTSTTDIY